MPNLKKHTPSALAVLALFIALTMSAGAQQIEQAHVTDSIPDTLAAETEYILSDTAPEVSESVTVVEEHSVENSVEHGATTEDHAPAEHQDGEHQEAEEHDGEHEGGGHELPNIMTIIFGHKANPTITDIQYWENVIFGLFGGFILIFFARRVYRRREMIPGPLQNFAELLVENFYDFIHGILGNQTKRFLPFLGTLFFYILFMNLMGLVPFLKAPSTSINITASLAILVFLYSQYVGLKELGFRGWVDHLAGEPRDLTGWLLVPLMMPIHIIGEIAKPFSLAARLFGNITGEDVLIFAFVMLGISIMSAVNVPVGLPLQAIFVPLGMLLSTIQALVFTVLSTIYISMMLPHEEAH